MREHGTSNGASPSGGQSQGLSRFPLETQATSHSDSVATATQFQETCYAHGSGHFHHGFTHEATPRGSRDESTSASTTYSGFACICYVMRSIDSAGRLPRYPTGQFTYGNRVFPGHQPAWLPLLRVAHPDTSVWQQHHDVTGLQHTGLE